MLRKYYLFIILLIHSHFTFPLLIHEDQGYSNRHMSVEKNTHLFPWNSAPVCSFSQISSPISGFVTEIGFIYSLNTHFLSACSVLRLGLDTGNALECKPGRAPHVAGSEVRKTDENPPSGGCIIKMIPKHPLSSFDQPWLRPTFETARVFSFLHPPHQHTTGNYSGGL